MELPLELDTVDEPPAYEQQIKEMETWQLIALAELLVNEKTVAEATVEEMEARIVEDRNIEAASQRDRMVELQSQLR